MTNKRFLYNPDDPKKSFDVYIDKDETDTIPIKYKTIDDVKDTIHMLENLFKSDSYTHKRIWQVAMIMKVRLGVIKKHQNTKYPNAKLANERYQLALNYYNFLKHRTTIKGHENRQQLIFRFN